MKTLVKSFSACMIVLLAGCATIVGDKNAVVTIISVPPGAKVIIADETGTNVYQGVTPTTVTLAKSTGHYWGKKNYTVTISLQGYKDETVALTDSANGWYIGGNIIFGGLIGWFLVDPFNGGMYTLSPTQVNATLNPATAANFKYKKGTLAFMLVEDVPPELRAKMVKVGQLTRR